MASPNRLYLTDAVSQNDLLKFIQSQNRLSKQINQQFKETCQEFKKSLDELHAKELNQEGVNKTEVDLKYQGLFEHVYRALLNELRSPHIVDVYIHPSRPMCRLLKCLCDNSKHFLCKPRYLQEMRPV